MGWKRFCTTFMTWTKNHAQWSEGHRSRSRPESTDQILRHRRSSSWKCPPVLFRHGEANRWSMVEGGPLLLSYKWSCNPCKWPKINVSGVITLLQTGKGAPCTPRNEGLYTSPVTPLHFKTTMCKALFPHVHLHLHGSHASSTFGKSLSSWWLNHPFEKYACQNHFPK